MMPNWRHETLALEVAPEGWRRFVPFSKKRHTYIFRTLSLYDVWRLWGALIALYHATKRGKPMEFGNRLAECIAHLCPDLAKSSDRDRLKPVHFDLLIEFYERQDWARIKVLLDDLDSSSASQASRATEQVDAERRFFAVSATAAKYANMSIQDFIEHRFEFCADAMIALRDEFREHERRQGKMDAGQFFSVISELVPRVEFEPGEKPEWIEELNRQSGEPPVPKVAAN